MNSERAKELIILRQNGHSPQDGAPSQSTMACIPATSVSRMVSTQT